MAALGLIREQAAAFFGEIRRIRGSDSRFEIDESEARKLGLRLDSSHSDINEIEPRRRGTQSYRGPGLALAAIEEVVKRAMRLIDAAELKDDLQRRFRNALTAQSQIERMLDLLGFVLRSTSPRLGFEVCVPLEQMAQKLLGSEKLLVLSSEWQLYTPFIKPRSYGRVDSSLRDFVFVGFPATESSNPLLLPLAGHELGHPLWQEQAEVPDSIPKRIESSVTTRVFAKALTNQDGRSGHWARARLQEAFCDALGVRLFGPAFCYAAAYLLGNRVEHQTPDVYLPLPKRVAFLEKAIERLKVPNRPGWARLFLDGDPKLKLSEVNRERLQTTSEAIDDIVIEHANDIIDFAGSYCSTHKLPIVSDDEIQTVKVSFDRLAPAPRPPSLPAILNAAWDCRMEKWPPQTEIENGDIQDERRWLGVLREAVLKTIQMLEYNELVTKSC